MSEKIEEREEREEREGGGREGGREGHTQQNGEGDETKHTHRASCRQGRSINTCLPLLCHPPESGIARSTLCPIEASYLALYTSARANCSFVESLISTHACMPACTCTL